jgi:Fe2+ or Zn2+ uptake regulation protein
MTESHTLTAGAIRTAFDDAGLRHTRPRQALAEQVARYAAAHDHFTGEDLWRAAQQEDPGVGRATAFRLVEVLVGMGLLDRVAFSDGTERYHAVAPGEHHHHLTCECCHKIVEVDTCLSARQLNDIARRAGFALSGHRIELFGRCPDCQRL